MALGGLMKKEKLWEFFAVTGTPAAYMIYKNGRIADNMISFQTVKPLYDERESGNVSDD